MTSTWYSKWAITREMYNGHITPVSGAEILGFLFLKRSDMLVEEPGQLPVPKAGPSLEEPNRA